MLYNALFYFLGICSKTLFMWKQKK